MKIKFFHLLLPLLGTIVAANLVSVEFWNTSKPSILTVFSVTGAGVLVMLARGLPFSNADQLQLDEVKWITSAIK